MSEKISVLVADDHTIVRKGICALLSAGKYGISVVGEAADGFEAVEKVRQLKPDVILMDVMMPRMDGIQAITLIREEFPEARILVLTSFSEDEVLLKAIDAGAMGYVMKDASPDVLVNGINNVFMDRMSIPVEMTRRLLHREQPAPPVKTSGLLTERERDVLYCVAKGETNKQIASELSISVTTVRTHVSSLLEKLHLENRTQLARYAMEQNLS